MRTRHSLLGRIAWLLCSLGFALPAAGTGVCGDDGRRSQTPDAEEAAVLALETAGRVSFERAHGDQGPVVEVTLGPILSKATLEQLRRFKHLRAVDIDWPQARRVSRSALALLADVPHLRRLNLPYFPIDDACPP